MEEKRLNKEQMGQAIDVRMADLKLLVDQHYGNMETIENTDQSTTQNIQTAVIMQNDDINAPTNFVFKPKMLRPLRMVEMSKVGGQTERKLPRNYWRHVLLCASA